MVHELEGSFTENENMNIVDAGPMMRAHAATVCARPLVAPNDARLGDAAATYIAPQAITESLASNC
jgi:hypothetical protein